MPRYVDGFLIPVPKKKLAIYRRMSALSGKIWKEYGALDYVEAVGDDLNIKGMASSFTQAAQAKGGEVVFFSFITYKSRKHRDAVNKKVMADPRMAAMCDPQNPPFDVKRMNYGGFKAVVDL